MVTGILPAVVSGIGLRSTSLARCILSFLAFLYRGHEEDRVPPDQALIADLLRFVTEAGTRRVGPCLTAEQAPGDGRSTS